MTAQRRENRQIEDPIAGQIHHGYLEEDAVSGA